MKIKKGQEIEKNPESKSAETLLLENRMLMDQLAAQRQIADTLHRDALIHDLVGMMKEQQKLSADMFAAFMLRGDRN